MCVLNICSRRQWHPTPVLLPGKSHGRRSLVGCSPWGRWGLDTTERFHFHFSLSCIGEGNGNPLQCSCLENPRDGGAWWAAVYRVAQSQTRLKWLSSSSSSGTYHNISFLGARVRWWVNIGGSESLGMPWAHLWCRQSNIFHQVGFSLDVPKAGHVLPGTVSSGGDMGFFFSRFKTHWDIPV